METNEAIIGLGSNLGDKEKNILKGAELLDEVEKTSVVALSPAYETLPVGPCKENFLNAAILIKTGLKPQKLLTILKEIEKMCGREPSAEWGTPRILDMDILLFGKYAITEQALTIPHKELLKRDFALRPLLDIYPEAKHPVTNKPLKEFAGKETYQTIVSPPISLPSKIHYKELEHTADLGIEVNASGEGKAKLFEACTMALADVIAQRKNLREKIRYNLEIQGHDDEETMVGLLQELIYLLEVKNFVPVRATVKNLVIEEKTISIKISLFGQEVNRELIITPIKAATYHMLEIMPSGTKENIWRARIFFDV